MPVAALVDARPVSQRQQYEMLRARLWSERSSFDAHWKDLADWIMPRRARFWTGDRNRGERRSQNIIDSTARFASRTLASGLHAGLTSPARPWMRLTTPNPDLAESRAVKEWLHIVTQRMLSLFVQTNLYNILPLVYQDMGVFGTAAMSILEDSQDLFRAYSYPIGSFAMGLDGRGLVTTFAREYQLTVRQVVEQFGVRTGTPDIDWSGISQTVRNLWDRGDYEQPIEVCWIVQPNDEARSDRLEAKYLPWRSVHFERGQIREDRVLRESGFRMFPVMCPRWDVTPEDAYGTDCPGMTALGDIRQLQVMQRRKGQAISKMIDPPLSGPSSLRTQKTSLLAGDITYVDVREGQQGLRPIHEVDVNLDHLRLDINEVQYRVQRAFYEDLFLMLARSDAQRGAQPPTAREIEERHEEKLLALGPVLERTSDELLDPLVDRVYAMMDQVGMIPEPPPELDGANLKVEYTSIMHQAQKLLGVVGQDRFVQTAVGLAQVFPEARYKIDVFQVVDDYAEMLGVNPRIVRSNEAAGESLEAEREQQQALVEAQQAQTLARAGKDASQTELGRDSALDRMVGSLTG